MSNTIETTRAAISTVPRAEGGRELGGQTVVLIGGSSGIGLETARHAHAQGAEVILTGRNSERLQRAAKELDAPSTAAFDANDPVALESFFRGLPGAIDHVMVTAGRPYYARVAEMDLALARRAIEEPLMMAIEVARYATGKVRPGGTLLFICGIGGRPGLGLSVSAVVTAALPGLAGHLALEIAPIRVNLITAGFVDTSLSASLLGNTLEERRKELRAALPIRRVVGPSDVAALAVHIMVNEALTGATFTVDGGEQVMPE
jgi:NAD(P)-dependent dehydrogenase (short-subunit alcohol dehydrogenase family)